MVNFQFEPTVFPDVRSTLVADGRVPRGYSFYFLVHITSYHGDWIRSLRREVDEVTKSDFIVRSSVCSNGVTLACYGRGGRRGLASDRSLYSLYSSLLASNPQFFMPRYLIGYPNIRGHCYLIVAILPLLNSYPFVTALLEAHQDVVIDFNLGLVEKPLPQFDLVERPGHWTQLLYRMHRHYVSASITGVVPDCNLAELSYRSALTVTPSDSPEYHNPDLDVILDSDLVRSLCSSLRNFCNSGYNEAGGDERFAYCDILHKFCGENPKFMERFFLRLGVLYLCRRCVGGPFYSIYSSAIIVAKRNDDFQLLLSDLTKLAKIQGYVCANYNDGGKCGGELRTIVSCTLLSMPQILCFGCNFGGEETTTVPEDLSLDKGRTSYQFFRFASSNCFPCWKRGDGSKPYGVFYHERVDGDVEDDWHTYVTVKTKEGFFEVNNGEVYTCDPRLFGRTTSGSLHFYQCSDFLNYCPDLLTSVVKANPLL